MRKIGRFFKKHWLHLLIAVLLILIIWGVVSIIKMYIYINTPSTGAGTSGNSPTSAVTPGATTGGQVSFSGNSGGDTGIVTIDGNKVSVFETEDEAIANPVVASAEIKAVTLKDKNDTVSCKGASISNISGNDYELNLEGLADGATVMLTVMTGGDGSFIGQRLGSGVETHYIVVSVSNPVATTPPPTSSSAVTPTPGASAPSVSGNTGTGTTAAPSGTTAPTGNSVGVPTGTVSFGDSKFKTYGSETEAQAAVAGEKNKFTIPTSMAKNLVLTAEPSEGTSRIWASVCMVDGEDHSGVNSRMNADSNWSATFDLSNYAGHQVTIMLKAEDGMGFNNGYSYVSFFVPSFEVEEEHVEQIVVTQ